MFRFFVSLYFFLICSAAFSDDAFNKASQVFSLVKKNNLKTAQQVLAALPQSFTQQDSSYVLIKHPQGLQYGSSLLPRLVLFSGDAKLLMAFGGDSNRPSWNSIEMIEFNDDTATFVPAQLQLDPQGAQPPKLYYGHDDAHLQTCVMCHRQNFRPNWDSYPTWPTAYGNSTHAYPEESKEFTQFLQSAPNHPLYSKLSLHNDMEGSNTEFSLALSLLNFKRMVRQMKELPGYEHLKYALWGALMGCDDAPSFFPEGLLPQTQSYEQLKADTLARILRQGPQADRFLNVESLDVVTGLRSFLEPLDVNVDDWSMTFEPGTYRIRNDLTLNAVLADFPDSLPVTYELTGIFGFVNLNYPEASDDTCSQLRQLSLQAFQGMKTEDYLKLKAPASPRISSNPFLKCISCHVDVNNQSPIFIPFDEFATLPEWFANHKDVAAKLTDYVQGQQMPPPDREPLLQDEKQAIVNYMNGLALQAH